MNINISLGNFTFSCTYVKKKGKSEINFNNNNIILDPKYNYFTSKQPKPILKEVCYIHCYEVFKTHLNSDTTFLSEIFQYLDFIKLTVEKYVPQNVPKSSPIPEMSIMILWFIMRNIYGTHPYLQFCFPRCQLPKVTIVQKY